MSAQAVMARASELPFGVPLDLAESIDAYVDAYESEDIFLDAYAEDLIASARMLPEALDEYLISYYLRGGWKTEGEFEDD